MKSNGHQSNDGGDAAKMEAYLKVAAELLSVQMLPKDRAELERSITYWTLKRSALLGR